MWEATIRRTRVSPLVRPEDGPPAVRFMVGTFAHED